MVAWSRLVVIKMKYVDLQSFFRERINKTLVGLDIRSKGKKYK